jgi:hypothetical protein
MIKIKFHLFQGAKNPKQALQPRRRQQQQTQQKQTKEVAMKIIVQSDPTNPHQNRRL